MASIKRYLSKPEGEIWIKDQETGKVICSFCGAEDVKSGGFWHGDGTMKACSECIPHVIDFAIDTMLDSEHISEFSEEDSRKYILNLVENRLINKTRLKN